MFVMREEGKTYQEIGDYLGGRSKGTVWKAINQYKHQFSPVWRRMTALERARHVFERMSKSKDRQGNHGHMKDAEVRCFVIEKLRDDRSPEEIAVMMKRELPEKAVCFKTIYNFTKYEREDLRVLLAEKGKPRRQQVTTRRKCKHAAPDKRSIDERTIENNDRLEAGHLECDTIVSKKGGKGGVLVVVDRVARMTWIRRIPDLQAITVIAVLRALILSIPSHLRKSITFDNGSEFGVSEMSKLEQWHPGFRAYYCDPYAAWQRGSVENRNKRIRRYFPKGTDFALVPKEEVAIVEQKINKRLMKCLGWRSSIEVWDSYMEPGPAFPMAA